MAVKEEEKNDGFMNTFDFGEIQDVTQEEVVSLTPKEEEKPTDTEKPESAKNENKNLDVNAFFESKSSEEKVEQEEQQETIKSSDEHPDNIEKQKNIDDSSSGTPFAIVFAETLMEQGALSDFDLEDYKKNIEEKGEDGAILSLFEQQDQKHKDEIVAHYDKDYKEYLQLKEIGIPKEESLDLISMKSHYENITTDALALDNAADLRKNLISEYYAATTQLTNEEIGDIVTKIVDAGEDEKYAKAYLPKMQTHINTIIASEKQAKINARQVALNKVEETKQGLKTAIDSIEEIIPGQKINKKTKDKLYQGLTTTQSTTKEGRNLNIISAKREENTTKFDVTLAYLISTGAFDGKWENLEKKMDTKASKKLKEYIEKNTQVSDLNVQKKISTDDEGTQNNLDSMRGLV